jgi:lipopolysaccharide/colanic/teichoic acid biosynthesis glycosyltransferase
MTVQIKDLSDDIRSGVMPVGTVGVRSDPGFYRNFLKRVIDLALVIATSIVTIPLVLVLALIVALDGSAPFYRSARVGRRGRNFQMVKLRTMVPDADGMLERYLNDNPSAQLEWDSTQKLKSDPRITRFGHFLRKTSLDELPQLWNVFTGDMSLVGPRPMMPAQRPMYDGLAYYYLRPGITGTWQVSGRNEVEFSKRADFDRDYDRRLSFRTDVSLIFRTLVVVLKGTGY